MYPLEILRHLYLVPIGGYSKLLNDNEIGINSRFLSISNLRNEKNVVISSVVETAPFLFRDIYKVVPLVPKQYGAWIQSRRGEAVLSTNSEIEVGEIVKLNAVLSKYS